MKNLAKLLVIGVFALGALAICLNRDEDSTYNSVFAQTVNTSPTPPANTNANSANANVPKANTSVSNKTIPDEFTLSKDSVSEYGESPFNHKNHAFLNYNPDGKSVTACIVCHHTDQPKSSLKPPLVTSMRDVILTLAVFQSSDLKVSSCRVCHFQEGSVPDGKEMPKIIFTKDGKEETKEYNNELAYHINCNTCHDEAARLRPELKKKTGFATTKDCNICHKTN
jgi:cytochrome c553